MDKLQTVERELRRGVEAALERGGCYLRTNQDRVREHQRRRDAGENFFSVFGDQSYFGGCGGRCLLSAYLTGILKERARLLDGVVQDEAAKRLGVTLAQAVALEYGYEGADCMANTGAIRSDGQEPSVYAPNGPIPQEQILPELLPYVELGRRLRADYYDAAS
jgi:hypothetical protein